MLLSEGFSLECGKRNEKGVKDSNIIVDEETIGDAQNLCLGLKNAIKKSTILIESSWNKALSLTHEEVALTKF